MASELTGGLVAARRGSAVNLTAASLLATGVGMVTGPLVARALGPSGRGEVAAATVYAALAALVAGLGLPTAVGYAAATRSAPPAALLATTLRFTAVLLVPMTAAGVAVTMGPLSSLGPSGRLWATVLFAAVPSAVLGNCLNALLVAEGALGPLTRLRIVPPVLAGVATVATFVLGVLSVSVALLVATATTVATAVLGARLLGVRPAGGAPFGELVRFGLRSYPANLAVFATHLVDQAFIVAVLGPHDLGFYAVAVTISSIPNAVWIAVYSRYFSLVADAPDPRARADLVSEALRLTFAASLLVSGVIALASPVLLPALYGQSFRSALAPLLLLLPGAVVFGVSMVGESCLTAVGRPGRVTVAELAGLAVTLVGLPLVVPRFGIAGAAVLSSVSYLVVLLMCVGFLRRLCDLSLGPRRSDVVALASLLRGTIRRAASRRGGSRSRE